MSDVQEVVQEQGRFGSPRVQTRRLSAAGVSGFSGMGIVEWWNSGTVEWWNGFFFLAHFVCTNYNQEYIMQRSVQFPA